MTDSTDTTPKSTERKLKDRLIEFDKFLEKYKTPLSYGAAVGFGAFASLYCVERSRLGGARATIHHLTEEFADQIAETQDLVVLKHMVASDALAFIKDNGLTEQFLRDNPKYAIQLMNAYVASRAQK